MASFTNNINFIKKVALAVRALIVFKLILKEIDKERKIMVNFSLVIKRKHRNYFSSDRLGHLTL